MTTGTEKKLSLMDCLAVGACIVSLASMCWLFTVIASWLLGGV